MKKEGPNKGRIFYVCSKERPCKYFQWADELNEQSAKSKEASASASSGSSRNAVQDERVPNCNCNEPARWCVPSTYYIDFLLCFVLANNYPI